MFIKEIFKSGIKIIGARVGIKTPLRVMFFSNFRCNLKCDYCGIWKTKKKEMTTVQIKRAMDEFSKAGTIMWTFTGGEPLIRSDLKELVEYASKKFVVTTVTTNGILLKNKLSDLKNVTYLTVSLDGGKEVTDNNRGKGTFDKTMMGILAARKKGIDIVINSVVSKESIKNDFKGIKEIFEIAIKTKSKLNFSILYYDHFNTENEKIRRSTESCYLNSSERRYALSFIKKLKKKYRGRVMFSDSCIDKLSNPKNWKRCYAGVLYCDLFPDGTVSSCLFKEKQGFNGLKIGFENAFKKLKINKDCLCPSTCYTELNCIFSLNLNAVFENLMKYMRFMK